MSDDAHREIDRGYRMPRDLPEGWNPKEVLLVQLSADYDDGRVIFSASDVYPYPEDATTESPPDIKQFSRRIARDGFPNPGELPNPRPSESKYGPLDIVVDKPCYIVVCLNTDIRWRFRSSGPAITTKKDYGKDNCYLKHLNPEGAPLSDHGPGNSDICQVVYFAVTRRGYRERQGFNFHLDLLQNDSGTPQVIEIKLDPDVPDDGGGFPMLDWTSPYEP